MSHDLLAAPDRERLDEQLQQVFFQIMPSGETAKSLLAAVPKIITMASTGRGDIELEFECYRSKEFRSKLLLLVLMAKQLFIRNDLNSLEASLEAKTTFDEQHGSERFLIRLDDVQVHITSWTYQQLYST
jgi:hypothetical protein